MGDAEFIWRVFVSLWSNWEWYGTLIGISVLMVLWAPHERRRDRE